MKRARGMLGVNPMIGPLMDHIREAQDDVLNEIEAFAQDWFERRHEATRTAFDTVREMHSDGVDPGAVTQAIVAWQQGSVQRLAEDVQLWVDLCARCAGKVTKAELEAGKEGVEKAARQAKSAAKTGHATPV